MAGEVVRAGLDKPGNSRRAARVWIVLAVDSSPRTSLDWICTNVQWQIALQWQIPGCRDFCRDDKDVLTQQDTFGGFATLMVRIRFSPPASEGNVLSRTLVRGRVYRS